MILANQNGDQNGAQELTAQQMQNWTNAVKFRNSMAVAKQLGPNHFAFCFDFEKKICIAHYWDWKRIFL